MKPYPLTTEQIEFAANWWSNALNKECTSEERSAFRLALTELLTKIDSAEWLFLTGEARLATDYDPDYLLREALRMAGLSKDSILLLPWKIKMFLEPNGAVTINRNGLTAPQFRRQMYPELPQTGL